MDCKRYLSQDEVNGFYAERYSSIAKLMNSNFQRSGINKIHSGYSQIILLRIQRNWSEFETVLVERLASETK